MIAKIQDAGTSAKSLTHRLLAFSRQQVLTPVVLSLNSLALDMESMLPRLLGEDIQVSFALEPALQSVKADPSQIEQVIMNLAVNSRDAMPVGETRRRDDAKSNCVYLVLVVSIRCATG